MKLFYLSALLLVSQICTAQTLNQFFVKATGQKTTAVDSAAYLVTISSSDQASVIYDFTEKYRNGHLHRTGKTSSSQTIIPYGVCTTYFPTGKKFTEITYDQGRATAVSQYYPGGGLYQELDYKYSDVTGQPEISIRTCKDSTGKVLAESGNGRFIEFFPPDKRFLTPEGSFKEAKISFDKIYEEGPIKKGRKDGEWHGAINDLAYAEVYRNGKLVVGESTDKGGGKYIYKKRIEFPDYNGGPEAAYRTIAFYTRYPEAARATGAKGTVLVNFTVETDGSLTNIRAFRSPGPEFSAEAERVIALLKTYTPGKYFGQTTKIGMVMPVAFVPYK